MDKTDKHNFIDAHQNTDKDHLIFISYDTRDIDLVKVIDDIIQRVFDRKIATFIAKRDIKAGDDAFKKMLHDSLAKCTIVLALCTKRSKSSPWLWFESGAGFQKTGLIPVWSGVTPQEFNAPMTIFQGKSVQDRNEINELLQKIADVTGVSSRHNEITTAEFSELLEISKKLDLEFAKTESARIEDKTVFAFPAPNSEEPIHYLIEANFPVANKISLQKLMNAIEKSRFFLQNFNGTKYPVMNGTIEETDNGALILSKSSVQPFGNQIKQQLLLIQDNITITHWLRDYFTQDNRVRFIRSINFIDESAKLFLFFRNMCKHLNLSEFKMRIRLFGLNGGTLHSDDSTQKLYQSFKAPDSNEVEAIRTIPLDSSEDEFTELLMSIWEKFRTPSGHFPQFNDKEFLSFLHQLPET